jgi:DNA-directed RNA polymerase subunit K/omega
MLPLSSFLEGIMAIIYLEDLPAKMGNKYLAVNAIAQRARVLNDRNLQFLNSNAKKPVTEALEEVVAHKIEYRRLEEPSDQSEEAFSPFGDTDATENTKATEKGEDLFDQIYLEDTDDTDGPAEEVEEGL